jgi:hypothetical protein
MNYTRVKWNHTFPDEPVLIYSELDDERMEIRKVHIYPDGRKQFGDMSDLDRVSILSTVPLPSISDINLMSEFDASEISKDEFERMWASRQ